MEYDETQEQIIEIEAEIVELEVKCAGNTEVVVDANGGIIHRKRFEQKVTLIGISERPDFYIYFMRGRESVERYRLADDSKISVLWHGHR